MSTHLNRVHGEFQNAEEIRRFACTGQPAADMGRIGRRERLGGLLNYHARAACEIRRLSPSHIVLRTATNSVVGRECNSEARAPVAFIRAVDM